MTLSLKDREWKEFFIEDVADIISGRDIYEAERTKGNTPYVSATANNNGIGYYVGNKNTTLESDCLSVNRNGSVGYSFYHPYLALFSNDCRKLRLKIKNKHIGLFISQQITHQREKYGYGYKMGTARIKRQKIMLPINANNEPDYEYMEQYMWEQEATKQAKYKAYITQRLEELKSDNEIKPLNSKEWKEFFIIDIFDLKKGNQNNMSILQSGGIPLVSAKKSDNGYKDFISKNAKSLFQGNCISLNNDGDGGAGIAYFQPYNFYLDTHVTALNPKKEFNKHILLFLSQCITSQRDKFGHGYSLTNQRLSALQIMLPINADNEPDYKYMEQYMKSLEYKKLKAYLDWKQ